MGGIVNDGKHTSKLRYVARALQGVFWMLLLQHIGCMQVGFVPARHALSTVAAALSLGQQGLEGAAKIFWGSKG
jgi:hypothetical protein